MMSKRANGSWISLLTTPGQLLRVIWQRSLFPSGILCHNLCHSDAVMGAGLMITRTASRVGRGWILVV